MLAEISANLDTVIRMLDVMIAIGRYIFPITVAFVLLCAAAALNSVATGSIAGIIFWIILTLAGAIFAIQLVQKRNSNRIARRNRVRKVLPRVAEA